jgi:hypothetical protein
MADAPTESRPNHVAMLSGFPEELSNTFNRWKKNGRPFDHLLARASKSFAFGGPDVVEFFKAENARIESFPYDKYHSEWNPTALDLWSLEKYRELLKETEKDSNLKGAVDDDGVVFFIHLAGVDTNGHRNGALSSEYRDNAQYVDTVIEEIEMATRKYFDDERTLFIFTSDHGFPDIGGHGSADINARKCPFVAWGSSALNGERKGCDDTLLQRQLAGFATSILGLSTPANNIVVTPEDLFTGSDEQKSRIVIANYGQLVNEMCVQTKELAKLSPLTGLWFTWRCSRYKNDLTRIEEAFKAKQYEAVYMWAKSSTNSLQWTRLWLFLWKMVMAGLPFAAICIFYSASTIMAGPVPVRRETRTFVRTGLVALMVAGLWTFLGYRSITSGICSLIAAIILARSSWNVDWKISMKNVAIGIMMISVFWGPKMWIFIPLAAFVNFYKANKPLACKSFGVGLALFLSNYTIPSMIKHIIPVIGVPYCLHALFSNMNPDSVGSEELCTRILLIALGAYLKVSFLTRRWIPSISLLTSLLFLLGFYSFIGLSVRAFLRRGHCASIIRVLSISAAIGTLAVLVDPILCFTIAAVLMYESFAHKIMGPAVYELLATGKTDPVQYSTFIALLLLITGPAGLTAFVKREIYSLGSVAEYIRVPNMLQIPLMGIAGSILWALLVKHLYGGATDEFLSTQWRASLMISSVVVVGIMATLPHNESWLEIETGIVKVFVACALPTIYSIAFALVSTFK